MERLSESDSATPPLQKLCFLKGRRRMVTSPITRSYLIKNYATNTSMVFSWCFLDSKSLVMLSFFCLCINIGCARNGSSANYLIPKSKSMVSVIQMPQNFRDWAASHIEAEKGDRLISIYANPMEENMHIWERWIEEKRVVCNVYSKNNKGVIKEKREYEVDDENAVLIFRRLYDQASQNFNYSDPGWSSDFHVTLEYIFTTGTKRGMTINEGSTNEFILKDALRFAESGDSISFEEAKASFDLRGFASIATHICFAVDSFDQLCSAYYNLRWVKDPEQAK